MDCDSWSIVYFIDKKKHHISKSFKKATQHDFVKAHKGKSGALLHKKEDVEKSGKKHHAVDSDKHHIAHHETHDNAHKAAFKHADKQKKTGFVKVSFNKLFYYS